MNRHQDRLEPRLGDHRRAARRRTWRFINELGATIIRLSHYEHAEHHVSLADHHGIVLWTEIPLVNGISSANFNANAASR